MTASGFQVVDVPDRGGNSDRRVLADFRQAVTEAWPRGVYVEASMLGWKATADIRSRVWNHFHTNRAGHVTVRKSGDGYVVALKNNPNVLCAEGNHDQR